MRKYRLSSTYDRQKNLGNAHVDIVTIFNLQFVRNFVIPFERSYFIRLILLSIVLMLISSDVSFEPTQIGIHS